MSSLYDSRQRLKYIFILVAMLIAIASLLVSDRLIKDLEREERVRIETWLEAYKSFLAAEETQDVSLILQVLNSNTTIPIIWVSENDSITDINNIVLPEKNQEEFKLKKLREFKANKSPLLIDMEDGTYQYLYYDDSLILKRLALYPYAQLAVMFIFILIAFLALASTKKAEQNKVWVGLSKETAHQLGTPISSLMAWMEYLKMQSVDPSLLGEMEKDVARLEMVAERFSKIGSNPTPVPVNIATALSQALDYMKIRISF